MTNKQEYRIKVISYLIATLLDITLITFIVLKLLKVINWSWVWVASPFWIPFILISVFALYLGRKGYTLP